MFFPSMLCLQMFAWSTVAIWTRACYPWNFSKMTTFKTSPNLEKILKRTSALTGNLTLVIVIRITADGLYFEPNLSFWISYLPAYDTYSYLFLNYNQSPFSLSPSPPSFLSSACCCFSTNALAYCKSLNSTNPWDFCIITSTFWT